MKEKIAIELRNKTVVLTIEPFDSDIDVDEMVKIHYHNIMGELLTCSVLLNRVGIMLADVSEILAETKLDFDIFSAQVNEEQRKNLEFANEKGVIKKPTIDEITSAIVRLPQYKIKKLNLIKVQKNHDVINSWYWAVKDKSEKLNKMTDKLRPEDFERDLLEEKINGVMLKNFEKAIK